jgi:pilus assembly protein FimV
LRDTQRLKALETEVRTMSELTKQQTKELGTLKSDLVQAERSKYANPLVYALAALALAALGFAAWLWQRSRSLSAPWWGSAPSPKSSGLDSGKKPVAGRFSSQASSAAEAADRERELGFVAASKLITPVSAHAPLSAGPASPPTFISRNGAATQSLPVQTRLTGMQPASALGGKVGLSAQDEKSPDFEPSASAGLRPVNAEELFDIQQQADFFMSLGQHSQAIDILQNHIGENVETSALAYLDLFDIYHKVGMRDEFDALREEFNRVFNAQVPEYDQYGLTSRGLEQYATAMDRIIVLWPNVKVLEVIEESIFRKPDRDNKPFDLLAYRELMLLYAIAKDVCENEEAAGGMTVDFDMSRQPDIALPSAGADLTATVATSPAPRAQFSVTEIQPLSTTTAVPSLGLHSALRNEPLDNWEQALNNLPLVSKHVGVDIELDGMFDAPPVPNLVVPAPAAASPKPTPASPVAANSKDNSIDFDATAPFVAKPVKKS